MKLDSEVQRRLILSLVQKSWWRRPSREVEELMRRVREARLESSIALYDPIEET